MKFEVSKVLLECKLRITLELSGQKPTEGPVPDTVGIFYMDVNEDRLGLRSLRHLVDGFVCM